jgi:Transposase DDE domain group 1
LSVKAARVTKQRTVLLSRSRARGSSLIFDHPPPPPSQFLIERLNQIANVGLVQVGEIKEGKGAIKWTRLSCRTFAANAVRLQLHALAALLSRWLRSPSPGKCSRRFCG